MNVPTQRLGTTDLVKRGLGADVAKWTQTKPSKADSSEREREKEIGGVILFRAVTLLPISFSQENCV